MSKVTGNAVLLLGYLAGRIRQDDGLLAYRVTEIDAANATMTVEHTDTGNTYAISVAQTASTEWAVWASSTPNQAMGAE